MTMTRMVLSAALLAAACDDKGDDTGATGDGGDGGADTSTVEGYLASVGDVDLSTAEGQQFATSSSAGSVLTLTMLPIYLAGFMGGDCPALTEDGATQDYVGGCTDADGNTWVGTAHSEGGAAGGTITFDGFGFSGATEECPGVDASYVVTGTIDVTNGAAQDYDILAFVDFSGPDDDCASQSFLYGFDYEATVQDTGEAQVLDGTGKVGAEGFGAVDSITADEVVATCPSEPDSGSLTVTSGGDTLVVAFDGSSACDDPGKAPATLNGRDIGQLEVSTCATATGRASALLAFLAGLLAVVGRRRDD